MSFMERRGRIYTFLEMSSFVEYPELLSVRRI